MFYTQKVCLLQIWDQCSIFLFYAVFLITNNAIHISTLDCAAKLCFIINTTGPCRNNTFGNSWTDHWLTSFPMTTSLSGFIHSPPLWPKTSGCDLRLNAAICCGGVAYRLLPSDCKQDCKVCDTANLASSISWFWH